MIESTFIHEENAPMSGQYYIIINIKYGNIILNTKDKL